MLMQSDRERLQDCLLLLQSAQSILSAFTSKWEWVDEIDACVTSADLKISTLLRA
jgi:hypothetical protein